MWWNLFPSNSKSWWPICTISNFTGLFWICLNHFKFYGEHPTNQKIFLHLNKLRIKIASRVWLWELCASKISEISSDSLHARESLAIANRKWMRPQILSGNDEKTDEKYDKEPYLASWYPLKDMTPISYKPGNQYYLESLTYIIYDIYVRYFLTHWLNCENNKGINFPSEQPSCHAKRKTVWGIIWYWYLLPFALKCHNIVHPVLILTLSYSQKGWM